ncbi:uncharacterized protein LOC110631044 isoform X2 [Manihot esculenta]|uniref:uncharacterized protein LOC110631044 isoform X2 n=1 Tax=Manihot esculenta TaxID=3983 RepID=UPI000B5D51AB|nr:uncharacterized protein LOC110631044 isoform X2 [Manihot esculenta]
MNPFFNVLTTKSEVLPLMVLVQSSKFSLPSSSPQTTSFLLEPNSLSLALMHSDSSLSLFPSLPFPSPFSLLSKPQTLIPPPSSSFSFLLLHHHHLPHPRVLFLVAAPHKGGSQILFRFYILNSNNGFSKAQVVCNQKGLGFDSKFGVLVDVNHGVSIKIVGSINFFAMYSVSNRKVWVFALKPIGDGDGVGDAVKLMRCAVIDCCLPVWSISISFGYLILGEDNGVRVFNLRHLVKGNVKRVKSSNSNGNLDSNGRLDSKGLRLPNGVIGGDRHCGSTACNGLLDGKIDKHCVSVKNRSVRCRQDSGEGGAIFVAFKSKEVEISKSTAKAVSIQALSPKKFMILDSTGDLHILCLSNPVGGSNIRSNLMHLPQSMKVQKLAVLPDISSIIQAIFAGEKIQDLVPLAANAFLILGQGTVWAYAIP